MVPCDNDPCIRILFPHGFCNGEDVSHIKRNNDDLAGCLPDAGPGCVSLADIDYVFCIVLCCYREIAALFAPASGEHFLPLRAYRLDRPEFVLGIHGDHEVSGAVYPDAVRFGRFSIQIGVRGCRGSRRPFLL